MAFITLHRPHMARQRRLLMTVPRGGRAFTNLPLKGKVSHPETRGCSLCLQALPEQEKAAQIPKQYVPLTMILLGRVTVKQIQRGGLPLPADTHWTQM